MEKEKIVEFGTQFEYALPQSIIEWAIKTFDTDIAFACSFGIEDMCILNMLFLIDPNARVFYLDTSLFFKETYELIQKTEEKYKVKFECVKTDYSLKDQARIYGDELWKRNPDLCCNIRKVEPLKKKLSGLKAWMTGIRREQTLARSKAKVIEWDEKFDLVKINPIVRWSYTDVLNYVIEHDIHYNPLHDKGYPSIGCEPCTCPVQPGEDPRSGRWKGFVKKECGLHK